MKLLASYNVWSDSVELLEGSIRQIRKHVDFVYVVTSHRSNYGEYDDKAVQEVQRLFQLGLVDKWVLVEPTTFNNPKYWETVRRQKGIDYARENGYTHFICMDADEYYDSQEFFYNKEQIKDIGYMYSHACIWEYYKSPTLRFEKAAWYYVPFICAAVQGVKTGISQKKLYCDPTRCITQIENSYEVPFNMHHMTWIRSDIERKVRNSTAKSGITRGDWEKDWKNAKPGYHVKHIFNQKLVEVPNYFNIHI